MHSLNGVADAPGRVVLATGLHPVGGAEQESEGITGVRTVPIPELLALLAAGEITDNESLGCPAAGSGASGSRALSASTSGRAASPLVGAGCGDG